MKRQKCRLTDQQKIEIVEKYLTGNYTCADLGREYGVRKTSINAILRYRKVLILPGKFRKWTFNQHYFDLIDTEEKAYWLGFLYADGYNNETKHRVELTLQKCDKEILEKFNLAIKSNYPIRTAGKNACRIYLNGIHFSKRLAELGCFQNKSLTLKFPTEDQVPKHLLRHWLRGMWDGDGSFTLTKTKTGYALTAAIVGSVDICDKIKGFIENNLSINCNFAVVSDQVKRALIQGNQQVIIFLNWLYQDANIFLLRKFNKFNAINAILKDSGWKLTGKRYGLIIVEHDGKQYTVDDIQKITGLSKTCIRGRIRAGWDFERIITQPIQENNLGRTIL